MGGLFLFSEIYVRKDVFFDMGAKMKEYSSSQEEVVTEGKTNTQVDEIKILKLKQLINFKDHPFKVETNTELFELMQSIEKDGVLVPLLARPNPNGEGYELISGMFMPDFAVTVVYEGDIESKEWLYYEQDGFVTTLANWLNGRLPVEQIEQLRCEIVIPQQSVDANNNLIEGREE